MKKIILPFLFLIANNTSFASSEKYTSEGFSLIGQTFEHLIATKLCLSKEDCNQKMETYNAHGYRINYSIYNPDKNVLAEALKFMYLNGTDITRGVPIKIVVYSQSRKEYSNFLFPPSPAAVFEINAPNF